MNEVVILKVKVALTVPPLLWPPVSTPNHVAAMLSEVRLAGPGTRRPSSVSGNLFFPTSCYFSSFLYQYVCPDTSQISNTNLLRK